MIHLLNSVFNPYGRTAWLQPVTWTILPLVCGLILVLPWLQTIWKTVFTVTTSCGVLTLLMHVGRQTGSKAQARLFTMWDGKPSVAMLRHRDTRICEATKERYRVFLGSSVPMLPLASPDEETSRPALADQGYESATSWLLAQTRNRSRFGLLFVENVSYGFRRNVWALKQLALLLDTMTVAVAGAQILGLWTGGASNWTTDADTASWIVIGVVTVHAAIYATKIRPEWVRSAAESYARQLLAACDTLEYEQSCRLNAREQ